MMGEVVHGKIFLFFGKKISAGASFSAIGFRFRPLPPVAWPFLRRKRLPCPSYGATVIPWQWFW
jgi:hypothetical protein